MKAKTYIFSDFFGEKSTSLARQTLLLRQQKLHLREAKTSLTQSTNFINKSHPGIKCDVLNEEITLTE